jgi:hypothetical protein
MVSVPSVNNYLEKRAFQLKQSENSKSNDVKSAAVQFNPAGPAFPTVKEMTKDSGDQENLGSAIKGFFIFDLALKGIGLAYHGIKHGINNLKGLPTAPGPKLVDRLFTPNALGLELGKNVAVEACKKKVPALFKNPLGTFKQTFSKVAGESISGRSLLKFSGATGWIIFGLVLGIGDAIKAFKKGPVEGVKQIGKTIAEQSINAVGFISGELIGSSLGAAIGGIAGGPLGMQIGGWAGGLIGGCTGSFFADKYISAPMGLTSKPDDKKSPQKTPEIQNKKRYA